MKLAYINEFHFIFNLSTSPKPSSSAPMTGFSKGGGEAPGGLVTVGEVEPP